jgi:polysaccharide export outer membrane protein
MKSTFLSDRSLHTASCTRIGSAVAVAILLCTVAMFTMFTIGCEGMKRGTPSERTGGRAALGPVSLTAGDVLRLVFPGAPELNQSARIRPDGKIDLPLIGEADAAGKTLDQFRREISLRYKSKLQSAEVVVTMESSGATVIVSGAVQRPGRLTFERPTTVLEAIMEAGGATISGNLGKVRVIQVSNGQHQTQILDLKPALSGKPTPAYYVKGGDVIFVPEKIF